MNMNHVNTQVAHSTGRLERDALKGANPTNTLIFSLKPFDSTVLHTYACGTASKPRQVHTEVHISTQLTCRHVPMKTQKYATQTHVHMYEHIHTTHIRTSITHA